MIYSAYSIFTSCANALVPLLSPIAGKGKFGAWVRGQNDVLQKIEAEFHPAPDTKTVWVHAASLGEFAVARPIINALKAQGHTIVVTFFSATGMMALGDKHPGIDLVSYLPIDTKANASRFLNIIKPQKAIFIISEFWPCFLTELKKRGIPTYLISALIRDDAPFFKPQGKWMRQCLSTFTHFMVLNEASATNLARLGCGDRTTVTGDPLFDNAIAVANTEWHHDIIERFASKGRTFIAGSVSDRDDLRLVAHLANKFPCDKFIIVPHEIHEDFMQSIEKAIEGKCTRVSRCTNPSCADDSQVLIVDFVGALAKIYRVGSYAYIGGGFTPLLHSVIEATVYGLPVSFGPQIKRKTTPQQLIELGIGAKVETCEQIEQWYASLRGNDSRLAEIKDIARNYTQSNSGATETIINIISNSAPQ